MSPDDLRAWSTTVTTGLRDRRVGSIVLILGLAALAIPIGLSHRGRATPLASLPPAPGLPTAPVANVRVSAPVHREPTQDYLTGPRHDPFASHITTRASAPTSPGAQQLTAVAPAATVPAPTSSVPPATSSPLASSAGGSLATGRTQPVAPPAVSLASASSVRSAPHPVTVTVTVTTPAPTTTVHQPTRVPTPTPYAAYRAAISLLRSGSHEKASIFPDLARDQLLASDRVPFGMFLGIRTDRRTAVFLFTDPVHVSGQGRCAPSVAQCTFLELTPGQQVTLVVRRANDRVVIFTLRYRRLSRKAMSASIVRIDSIGAARVAAAATTIPALQRLSYTRSNGLLRLRLRATTAVSSSGSLTTATGEPVPAEPTGPDGAA